MPVQAKLDTPWRVTADLEEQRAELFVVDVEVIVIDVDRLVAVELELSVDLLAVEGLRFLLRHPDENDAILPLRRRRKLLAMSSFLSLCRN